MTMEAQANGSQYISHGRDVASINNLTGGMMINSIHLISNFKYNLFFSLNDFLFQHIDFITSNCSIYNRWDSVWHSKYQTSDFPISVQKQ